MHLGQGYQQRKLIFLDRQLEQSSSSDDLEAGQDDPPDIHVGDEDVASDLLDVLEEAEVQVLVLEPGQLQVSVHEGTVGVPVPQVPIVVLPVGRNRHSPVCTDTN